MLVTERKQGDRIQIGDDIVITVKKTSHSRVVLGIDAPPTIPIVRPDAEAASGTRGRMIYLASPYSHPDEDVRQQRFEAVCKAAASLMRAGEIVFSPIAHGHPIAQHGLPTDWRFWERQCREQIDRCDEVVVLTLDGWRESEGVQAEIQIAADMGKPLRPVAEADWLLFEQLTCRASRRADFREKTGS